MSTQARALAAVMEVNPARTIRIVPRVTLTEPTVKRVGRSPRLGVWGVGTLDARLVRLGELTESESVDYKHWQHLAYGTNKR
jgi:hypothetical protein